MAKQSYIQAVRELEAKGILICASSKAAVVEEMPEAYKDVDRVAMVAHKVKIVKLVSKTQTTSSNKKAKEEQRHKPI